MHTFTDSDGREWRLSLNVANLTACREAGVDLLDPTTLVSVGDDPYALGVALWELCREQAEALGLTPQQFAAGLGSGEVIEAVAEALIGELINFIRPERRAILKKAMETRRQMEAKALANMAQALDGSTLSDTPGNSPASSASTPGP